MTNREGARTKWLTLAVSLVLLLAAATSGAGEERGRITAVRLNPDMTQLTIRFEGEIGKHSAFVMGKPFRLVLDFESTGLGKIPGKIAVHRDPINEIRIGSVESRSRLVVDFGDRPVPAFKIEQAADMVTVRLTLGTGPGGKANVNPAGGLPRGSVVTRGHPAGRESLAPSKSVSPAISSTNQADARMVVKTAGITDNLVYVELVDRKDRKKAYRLVVDLDQERMNVRQATVSDETGNLKRFNLVAAGEDEQTSADVAAPPGSSAGPRKQSSVPSVNAETTPAKFKWGVQSSLPAQSPESTVSKRPGLRMKGFTLEERKPGNEG
ncbi:MAG: AMIN domain-containing protein [Desulfomonile tiedjei]|nr:AMIN domain-containing protein [Desulfomonile tiedjei]